MAIIAGQRVLRKSMLSDSIPEWTSIAKGRMTADEPPRRAAGFCAAGARNAGTIPANVSYVTLDGRVRRY
jgi:hypothetical protein